MNASDLPASLVFGSSGQSEEERAFFQERLGLFAMWIFILSGSFYLLSAALSRDPTQLVEPAFLFHLTGTLVIGAVWGTTRLFVLRSRALLALDAGGLVITCALFAGFALSLARSDISLGLDPRPGFLLGQTGSMATILARAIIVPSTAARTFWLGLAALTPLIALAVWVAYSGPPLPAIPGLLAPPELVITATLAGWSGVAIALSTVASRVIFGLRAEVGKVKRLGQYVLEEKIGEGGMGIVYRARHAMLRRPTAVKLLPPDRAGEDAIRRFEREVQVTARLSHPSTIAVFDYGRTPAGVFYYAMEYLKGLNLDELVRYEGPQPAGRVIHILEQVSGALTEAHESGLIHRDIKPANIILCERGGLPDVAKVVDFGLVRRITASSDERTVPTTARNVLFGTPLYMAPEAIKGEQFVDGRSDLYAVGAVGYFLLTGTPVFVSETVVEVLAHHLQSVPVPPSARGGCAVPVDLESVIMRCLAKDPHDRFATARELGLALHVCARTTPWSIEQASAWWKRFRMPREAEAGPPAARSTLEVDLSDSSPRH